MPVLGASVSKMNGLEKSGSTKTGASVMAFLRLSKARVVLRAQLWKHNP